MPFRRRRRRAKRSRSTAVKALKLARRAWAATDHEVKYVDFLYEGAIIQEAASAVTVYVNAIGQGDGRDQRIGERCSLKMLDLRLMFTKNALQVTVSSEPIRFLVVWDRQPNGGLATVNNILENIGATTDIASMLSQYDINNSKRFQILMDRSFTLDLGDKTGKVVHWRIPLKHKTPQYNGATANINQCNSGALLLVPLGGEPTVGMQTLLNGQYRLFFVG